MGYILFMLTTLPPAQMLRYALFVGGFLLAAVLLFLASGLSILPEGKIRIRYRKGKEPEIVGKGVHYAFPFTCKESKIIVTKPHKEFKNLIIEVDDPLLFDSKRKELKKILKAIPRSEFEKIHLILVDAGARLVKVVTKK